jgi:VWFA-related protein
MMRLWTIAAVAAVLAWTPAQEAPHQPQQEAVFRSSVDGVSVSVSVRQGNRPVTGLTAQDFELTDNGVRQQIATLSFEQLPIDVTLLLDVSSSVQGSRLERLKNSVLETAALLGPVDRLRLIAVQFDLQQVFPFQSGTQAPPVENLYAGGGTALFDGLAAAMMRAAEPDRRQLIVAYTDGQDTTSILGAAATRDIAGRADAVVHIVVPTSGSQNARREVPSANLLEDLALQTGGQLFLVDARAPISDAFRTAMDEFRSSYVLRYRPEGVERGGWHEIDVKVGAGEYQVRARRGYGG